MSYTKQTDFAVQGVLSSNEIQRNIRGTALDTEFDALEAGVQSSVSVKEFGAVGDGVTDDTAAIQAAFTASIGKTLVFPDNNTYLITGKVDVSNTRVMWNSSKVTGSFSGIMLESAGTIGTYYSLTTNAYEKNDFIKCTDATFLASLSTGDMVKIISDEIGNSQASESGRKIGELHIVRSVDSGGEVSASAGG
jgi:hypothetical protein